MMYANKIGMSTDGRVDSYYLIPPLQTFPGNDVHACVIIMILVTIVAAVIIQHVAKWPIALNPQVE